MSAREKHDEIGMNAAARASLRARLLAIVNSGVQSSESPNHGGAFRQSRRCTLLLDSGADPLNLEEIVAAIRSRQPRIEIIVFERTDDLRSLPCEFGHGPLRVLTHTKSSIRSAGEHWRQVRSEPSRGQGKK